MPDVPAAVDAEEARQVLGTAGDLRVDELAHNQANQVTAGIWRVAADDGRDAVLKVLAPPGVGTGAAHWAGSDDPLRWNWWRREAEVYRGGWPARWYGDGLDPIGGVGAPTLLASFDRPDGTVALWFETLADPGAAWSPIRHGRTARSLGRAQGDLLVRVSADPALRPEWVSAGFLRTYPETKPVDPTLLVDPTTWGHPLVAHVPPPVRQGLLELHHDRRWYYDLVERLPRTVCHLDVWPNNMFGRADGGTDLVDWSFTGDGALGEDPGNLVPDAVFDGFLPAAVLPELDRRVWDGYRSGLDASGWDGDWRLARLGMCASAVKYHWLGPLMLGKLHDEVHLGYGGYEAVDVAHQYRERFATLAHLVGWAAEARALAGDLGV